MYNRNAKGIDAEIWSDLMKPCSWKEVLKIADLVRLLVEDSLIEPTPLLKVLVVLINEALESGNTPISWRKAIISMIPKRKEDGSLESYK